MTTGIFPAIQTDKMQIISRHILLKKIREKNKLIDGIQRIDCRPPATHNPPARQHHFSGNFNWIIALLAALVISFTRYLWGEYTALRHVSCSTVFVRNAPSITPYKLLENHLHIVNDSLGIVRKRIQLCRAHLMILFFMNECDGQTTHRRIDLFLCTCANCS